jgi:hypothetical protein
VKEKPELHDTVEAMHGHVIFYFTFSSILLSRRLRRKEERNLRLFTFSLFLYPLLFLFFLILTVDLNFEEEDFVRYEYKEGKVEGESIRWLHAR